MPPGHSGCALLSRKAAGGGQLLYGPDGGIVCMRYGRHDPAAFLKVVGAQGRQLLFQQLEQLVHGQVAAYALHGVGRFLRRGHVRGGYGCGKAYIGGIQQKLLQQPYHEWLILHAAFQQAVCINTTTIQDFSDTRVHQNYQKYYA
nr:hypothetical protein [uncultured Desulfovibrio sp.]